jgi:Bifunctional DNA primase/polymerase, N-terminal/Primase C terminal 1 (PriCT-1)
VSLSEANHLRKTTQGKSALKIASRGKPVFPCKGKTPYTPRGFYDATTDPGRITAFFNRYPDANIGMPTGKASGVFVVDVDRLEALEELSPKLQQDLADTLTIRTPSGGRHYYFNHVEGVTNRTGTLPEGVDVRGEGGYVIVTPSLGYVVEHSAPIADASGELLEMLRDEPRSTGEPVLSRSRSTVRDNDGPIPEGSRDETLTRIAGRLHDGTRDVMQLEDDLQAVNETRCIPPLPLGQIRKIARSVYRYEPCRPARHEPDPEILEALATIERALLAREYKGQSGKTDYSIVVAALKLARDHGTLVEDGVRVEVSARQLALAAAVSRRTIANKVKNMGGILRPDNKNVEPGKAGAIVLLLPRAALHHSTHRVSSRGGCAKSRAPFTAPRLRWSSPSRRPRRGVTPGTCKVRDGLASKRRDAVLTLGKSCEKAVDTVEASGNSMSLPALADALDIKRPRELTRRKNSETDKGRDGIVTRLEAVGVMEVVGDNVVLTEDWLEALDCERDRAGEIELYKRDMRRYNRESKAYRNREKVKAGCSPSHREMRDFREGYPERRRDAIKVAIGMLFREHPEYRGRRAGQITCRLLDYLSPDFPRGPDGAPKDAEIEAILDGDVRRAAS